MTLLLLVLPIALAIIVWIAWLPVGPRYGHTSLAFDARNDVAHANNQIAVASDGENRSDANAKIDLARGIEQHLQTRLELTQVPLSSVVGVQPYSNAANALRQVNPETAQDRFV